MEAILSTAGALLLPGLLTYLVISGYIVHRLTQVKRQPPEPDPGILGLPFEAVSFPSRFKQHLLHGWYLPSRSDKRVITLVHGYQGHRADPCIGMMEVAKELVQRDLSILTFDLRGHGASEGKRFGPTHLGRSDLLGALDFLQSKGFSTESIGVLGFSLGAVVALLAAAHDPRLLAVALDSPFAHLGEMAVREASKHHSLAWLFYPGMLLTARALFGIRVHEVQPTTAAQQLGSRHLLIIHGEKDPMIPVEHAYRLYHASSSPNRQLWVVSGAGHVQAYKMDPEEYIARVSRFFTQTLK